MESQESVQSSDGMSESNDAIVSRLAQKDKVPWYNKPNLRLLYLLMVPTCLAVEVTTGYDSTMVNGLQAVPSWIEYYHHPHSTSLGLMASMYSLGCIAASPFAPFIVDRLGRRHSMVLGSAISIIGGILQGSAMNFTMFIVARFILGFSIIFSVVAGSCLAAELSHPKERPVISSLFVTAFYAGAVIAAGVTLWTFSMSNNWGWRIPSLLQAAPALVQVLFIRFIPESPRWLTSRGRRDEALAILVKYHAEGDEDSEFVRAEYAQIEEMLEMGQKIPRMDRKLFLSQGMKRRVLITTFLGLCSQWSGHGLISNYLAPILDSIGIHDNRTKNIINFVKAFWRLVTTMTMALIVPQYPRRTMYLACAISVFVILVTFTVASADYSYTQSQVSALVVLALLFLHPLGLSIGIGTLNITFLTELFPFHARASGIALYQWWLNCGSFSAQFMNPIGLEVAGWRWYIVPCVVIAFMVVFIYWIFPETSGRTLEELMLLYDDDQEVLREGGVAILREHGGAERYGTMEGGQPSRTGSAERC